MIKKIKFVFKTLYIISLEGSKYLFKRKKNRNFNKFIMNVSSKLSKENIFYLKLLQSLSNNISTLTPELEEYFEKYTDNVDFSDEDIDKEALNCILTLYNEINDYIYIQEEEQNTIINKEDFIASKEEQLIIDTTPIKSGIISIIFKGTIGDKNVIIKIKRKNILNKLNEGLVNIEFLIKILNYLPVIKKLNLYN